VTIVAGLALSGLALQTHGKCDVASTSVPAPCIEKGSIDGTLLGTGIAVTVVGVLTGLVLVLQPDHAYASVAARF
jgi:hypothetical protein